MDKYITFRQYLVKQNKVYTPQEYKKREQIYNKRIQSFKEIKDYQPGVNQFTDQTDQEFQKNNNLQSLNNRVASPYPQINKVGAALSIDWRTSGIITSIKNQGSCGACWAFSTIAFSQSKLINQKKQTINADFSEQYVLSCTSQSDCGGGYIEYAFQTISQKGVVLQTDYPYIKTLSSKSICYITQPNKIQVTGKVLNYYDLSDSQIINLLQDGPVAISISSKNWNNYNSGIFSCPSTVTVDHAVLLIGYTSDYWIIKNQWGQTWGQAGYMRITRNTTKNCKIGNSVHLLFQTHLIGNFFIILIILLTLAIY